MKATLLIALGYVWFGAATLALTAHAMPRELWRAQFFGWPLYVGARVYRYWLEYRKIRLQMHRETAGMSLRETFKHTRMRANEAAAEEQREREALKAQGRGSWLW